MVIFRLRDNEGHSVTNFDLILTTGVDNDPDNLPKGFFADRQRNQIYHSTLTYYFNYDVMMGWKEIILDREVLRSAITGIESLGINIRPRPVEGFVSYVPCEIKASKEVLQKILKPNSTTLVDICLFRLLSTEIFRFEKTNSNEFASKDFKDAKPGKDFLV
jgi:hypothetical protein